MISGQLEAKWNLLAIKGDYIYWDGVGEFLSHLFEELDKKEKQKSDREEYLFPFSEWLDIALSHSGNSLGSSFSGANNWREWKLHAKANKWALISDLTRISNENKLQNRWPCRFSILLAPILNPVLHSAWITAIN